MAERELDTARRDAAVLKAVRAEGYAGVTMADVEETQRDLRAGRQPEGLITRAIARHLRLLEESGG